MMTYEVFLLALIFLLLIVLSGLFLTRRKTNVSFLSSLEAALQELKTKDKLIAELRQQIEELQTKVAQLGLDMRRMQAEIDRANVTREQMKRMLDTTLLQLAESTTARLTLEHDVETLMQRQPPPPATIPAVGLALLRATLKRRLNEDELAGLAFDTGIQVGDLGTGSYDQRLTTFLALVVGRNLAPTMIANLRRLRPDITDAEVNYAT